MQEERRTYLKAAVSAGVVGVSTFVAAKYGVAADNEAPEAGSNGVVVGHSPKKEVLYKKTANWERYYKAAY